MKDNSEALNDSLRTLEGRALSSVEFVKDYVQFRFDGPCLTAYIWPTVQTSSRMLRWGDACYRDALCDLIGNEVKKTHVDEGEELSIHFKDGTSFRISLKQHDYRGPEAVHFLGEGSSWWVI